MVSTEKQRIEVVNLPDFWSLLRVSEKRLLALDYDGTLAPFHIDPMKAYPLPEIKELLIAIGQSDDTRLAIVSGRPVFEVLSLLGDLGITLIGSHGFELRLPDGDLIARSPSPVQFSGLEEAIQLATQLGWAKRLEKKIASVALHTRGMETESAREVERRMFHKWSDLAPFYQLDCRRFNGGVEIRSLGFDKGDAIFTLLKDQPQGAFNVYIGDDDTDEDAFRTLREQGSGFGIRVGYPAAPSAATGFLPDCEGVRLFLKMWLTVTRADKN
jgi:trehalose 6-phosphate phosphatase